MDSLTDSDNTAAVCWACQKTAANWVVIAGEPISVCRPCWAQVPVAKRVELGMLLGDREAGGTSDALRRMAEMIIQRLDSAGGFWDSIERGRN